MAKQETAGAVALAEDTDGAAEGLPVDSLREAAPYLRRPFTAEAIKFKVQTVFGGASGCLVVAYIDARLVIERLNLVVPDMWYAAYEPIGDTKLAWCHLTVADRTKLVPPHDDPTDPGAYVGRVVTRSDVGESPKGMSKDLVSDALKRAAVHFGVGVSVYALPQIALFMRDAKGRIEKKTGRGGDTIALTEHGHVKLREGYAKWLAEHGVARFGQPLDHGDVEGATIDVDDGPEEFAPEPAPALDDDKAQKLRAAIQASYDRFRVAGDGTGGREVPPQKYRAWLDGAAHSHEELERLLAWLEQRRGEIEAGGES